MSAVISDNLKFVALIFKNQNVVIFNGLVALGTLGSQQLYSFLAFNCPCARERNYLYGLAAIGVPVLALFIGGVILNTRTWNLVTECRRRWYRNCSAPANFLLFGSIIGQAVVAPITWSVISLLQGEAYVCALSEFVDPATLTNFPSGYGAETLAKFPCKEIPAEALSFKDEVIRRLKFESQLIGWLVIGVFAVSIFLLKCLKHCCSQMSFRQEDYWSEYRSAENMLFSRTAEVHAKVLAASNVKQFFGMVALDKDEKELVKEFPVDDVQPTFQWDDITGVYTYKETNGLPVYSRLHKWAKKAMGEQTDPDGKEMTLLGV
ncbi:calcium homeostasis modulator protein 2-like [Ambystoma mexicanum]|uniref:calcium homeostasis modulator protein 2-like n=1 Tax=Ambystoma mexicanum TaxID=8296 RepID=UPI0037E7C86E